MKKAQSTSIRSPVREFRTGSSAYSKPMVSPLLLRKVQNKGINLENTHIEILGLGPLDRKELESAGILSLKQLAGLYDSDVRAVPHFGIIKVRRLKSNLKSILSAMLDAPNHEPDQKAGVPDSVITASLQPDKNTFHSSFIQSPESELEKFHKTLEKLERRLASLESRFARLIRK